MSLLSYLCHGVGDAGRESAQGGGSEGYFSHPPAAAQAF